MIASKSRNFIFIKTPKTGGTSIEIVLSSWCSRSDICTPFADDELLRYEYGGLPRNFGAGWWRESAYRRAIKKGNKEKIAHIRQELRPLTKFYNHMPATAVADALPDLWRHAYKFTIERHPYERAVSVVCRALWKNNGRPGNSRDFTQHPDFTRVMDEMLERGKLTNYPLYTQGGRVIVDAVVPYERAWAEISILARRFGVTMPNTIPMAKSGYRGNSRPALEILSRDQKRRIVDQCAPEFELMGYNE